MKKLLWILITCLTVSVSAQEPAPPTTAPAVAPAVKPAAGSVSRAVFTTGIADREPVDSVTSLGNNVTQIYFFTELKDLAGQTVTHRWEFNDKAMAEIKFEVGAARWRVFSSKTLDPLWLGTWKVSVVDAAGGVLSATTFNYTQAPASAPAPASVPAPTTPAQ